ncbi:MAG: GGDEF domain-containing protein, partial [Oscillospiraceae bacterium]
MLVESRLLQLLIPYPVALTNSSFFALTLLPLFSGMYYYNTHATHPRSGKWVMILAALASASFAAITCVRPMAMPQLLPYYLFFMGLYILAVLISILLETLKIGRFFSASFCGVIGFGSCAVVELALYFSNMKGYHPSDFLTLGLLWFSVAMAVDTIQNLTHVYQAAVKVETLSILAYTDGLTGLKNRTAFLERMSTLGTGEEGQVTLTMFDINDLKVVNDTSGHLVGDAMLRHGAKAIGRSLRQEDELYRIGGDEFVAVICHDGLFNCRCVEDRMRAVLQEENQKALSYRLNIACGCATFEKSTDKTLFETLSRADKNMYACKQA